MYFFLFLSSASGRIIGAKDHASVQICIAEVGYYYSYIILCVCGFEFYMGSSPSLAISLASLKIAHKTATSIV